MEPGTIWSTRTQASRTGSCSGPVPVSVVNASMDTLWHRTVEIVDRYRVPAYGAAYRAHRAQKPRCAASERYWRSCTRMQLYRPALTQRGRCFLHAGCRNLPHGLCQPGTSSGCWACRSSRCSRTSVHCGRCTRRISPTTDQETSSRGFSAASSANGTPILPVGRTGVAPARLRIVAMAQRLVAGRTKYILVMSDRTADRKIDQALSRGGCRRRSRQPRQEHLPVQYVARYPHTDECRSSALPALCGQQYRRSGTGEGLSDQNPLLEPPPARAHRRYSGHEPHRERQAPAGGNRGRPVRDAARHQDHRRRTGARQAASSGVGYA